ncbi:hypothetical protein PVAND_008278 [Polypedilum vanderplanki]|uniref:Uncharacterized protein n=1 Tax=Polypedilum vanderplanki TaxID=319348 RepID=A0A9J6C8Z3_POLVA|nr:hypothetical protein PVAND_008278 [Polypedilum vanderplanki]
MQAAGEMLCTWSVQVNHVSRSRKLHEILRILTPHVKSIFAISRNYDFNNFIFGDSLFISLLSRAEAEYLIEQRCNLFASNQVSAEIVYVSMISLQLVRSHASVKQRSMLIGNIKSTIQINELSAYILEISEFFCDNITVTGIRLIIDKKRHKIRNFAFIDCVSLEDTAHFVNFEISFGQENRWYTCKLSESIPILLRNNDLNLIGNDQFGEKLIKENLLSTTVDTSQIEVGNEFINRRAVFGGDHPDDLQVVVNNELEVQDEGDVLLINENVELND